MDKQQKFVILLSILVIIVSISIGNSMFKALETSVASVKVIEQIEKYANDAQIWYRRPRMMGGGGQADPQQINLTRMLQFMDRLAIKDGIIENNNGRYRVSLIAGTSTIMIEGTKRGSKRWVNVSGTINLDGNIEDLIIKKHRRTSRPMF